jgi:hypothetical protein
MVRLGIDWDSRFDPDLLELAADPREIGSLGVGREPRANHPYRWIKTIFGRGAFRIR